MVIGAVSVTGVPLDFAVMGAGVVGLIVAAAWLYPDLAR